MFANATDEVTQTSRLKVGVEGMAKRNEEVAMTTTPMTERRPSGNPGLRADIKSDLVGNRRRGVALLTPGSIGGERQPLLALWDAVQLAERLGVSPRFVRRLVEERRVPFLKVGKFVRFDPAEIADWLEVKRVAAVGAGSAERAS